MNNPNLISYIESKTGERNLRSKTLEEVVNTIVLPKMVGGPKREFIGDAFMHLMREHYYSIRIECKDLKLYQALQQLALQRLTRGAVEHDYVEATRPLPNEYFQYSAVHDAPYPMTEGCCDYILSDAFEATFYDDANKHHAEEIAFGIIRHTLPNGSIDPSWNLPEKFRVRGQNFYSKATYLVEKYSTFETIFDHYAQPSEWQKHKCWFANNYQKIDWDMFFERTKTLSGNWVKRFFMKREIKRKLYRLSLPVASY